MNFSKLIGIEDAEDAFNHFKWQPIKLSRFNLLFQLTALVCLFHIFFFISFVFDGWFLCAQFGLLRRDKCLHFEM